MLLIAGNTAPTELPPVVEPSPADDPFACSGPIDWADEVEQELFGASSDPIFSETKPEADEADDSDDSDDEILMIVPIEDRRFVASGAGYTLYTIPEVDEKEGEKDEAEESELDITDQANLTLSPTISTLATSRTITLADIRPPVLLLGNDSLRDIEANDYYDDRVALDHDE